jgi:phage shock protein C
MDFVIISPLFLVLLLTVLAPVVVVAIALMALSRGGGRQTPSASPTAAERSAGLRKQRDRYREERSRILGMIDDGTVTAAEASRLLDTVERETTIMACPFCGEDVRVEAVKCKHCGQFLVQEMVRPRTLCKSHNRVLAGVCGGVADYMGVDPTLVRVLVALVSFFTALVPALLIYIVAAIILPDPN